MDEKDKKSRGIVSLVIILIFTMLNTYMIFDMSTIMESWLVWLLIFASMTLSVAVIVFDILGKKSIAKLGIMLIVLVAFMVGTFYVFYKMDLLILFEDVDALKEQISDSKSIKASFILLQFAQIVFIPIPSTITIMLGLVLFDPFTAIFLSLIGIIPGSLAMFFFGKYAGRKAVEWAVGKEDLEKYLKMIKGKDNSIITAMFLLPFFPDDLICAVAGVSSMSTKFFIIMMTISRFISVSISAAIFTGNFIPFEGVYLILWCFLGLLALFCIIYFFKNASKVEKKFMSLFEKFKRKK